MPLRNYLIGVSFLFLIPTQVNGQKPYAKEIRLSGIVTNSGTGEKLSGVTIELPDEHKGTISNQYGFFSISGKQGMNNHLLIRHVGFTPYSFSFNFNRDSLVAIQLSPDTTVLESIEFASNTDRYSPNFGGFTSLSPVNVKATPGFGGEPDVLKTLQFLPGVQSGNEGTSNLSVRGGSYDQNLILLDEAPVYNPSHALSFFSIFNIDAVQSIGFYKSGIPLKYGGRLSSVVDVRMKEGNRKNRESTGSIGIIASRLATEGPLSKNQKWSYMISGRYSYAGHVVNGVYLLGKSFLNDPTANRSTTDNKISFYDLNAKVNFKLNNRNHFFISNYSGNDEFYFNHITNGYNLSWGNHTTTLRWNHVHNNTLFSNTTVVNSNYKYEYRILNNTQYFRWNANLQEQKLKQDYDLYLNDHNHVTFGFSIQNHSIDPGRIKPRDNNAVAREYKLERKLAIGSSVYASNTQSIGANIVLTYGLRYSNFGLRGNRWQYDFSEDLETPLDSTLISSVNLFHKFDPRVIITFSRNTLAFSASYDRTTQYFHLLGNSSVGLPTDLWWPSSKNIEPQFADIFAFNVGKDLTKKFKITTSLFYKRFHNVVDFRDNARLFVNRYVESQILQGRARAYGLELFLEKVRGKFAGSISYTLSRSRNTIPGVNNGKAYPTRYDKQHNLSATGRWALSPRIEMSGNFVVTSGGALTLPAGTFLFDGIPFNYYKDRNGYRLPTYHRLDLSFTYKRLRSRNSKFKSSWSLDIYNFYGRKNPFTLYAIQSDYGFHKSEVKALFLYRIVPSISYNFSF